MALPKRVGTCSPMSFQSNSARPNAQRSLVVHDGNVSKPSTRFGLPVALIDAFRADWAEKADAMIALTFSPKIECPHEGWYYRGGMKLRVDESVFSGSSSSMRSEITCRPVSRNVSTEENSPRELYAFVFRACVSMILVDGKAPAIEIFI